MDMGFRGIAWKRVKCAAVPPGRIGRPKSKVHSTREALTASAETLLAFSRTGECEDSTLALQFVFVCIY